MGLILCKNENRLVAEYALKDMTKPIGVSEYKLFDDLPNELQEALPTAEDIEARIIKKNMSVNKTAHACAVLKLYLNT